MELRQSLIELSFPAIVKPSVGTRDTVEKHAFSLNLLFIDDADPFADERPWSVAFYRNSESRLIPSSNQLYLSSRSAFC